MEERLVGVIVDQDGSLDDNSSFEAVPKSMKPVAFHSPPKPPLEDMETALAFVGPVGELTDRKLVSLIEQLGLLISCEQAMLGPDPFSEQALLYIQSASKTMKQKVSKAEYTALT